MRDVMRTAISSVVLVVLMTACSNSALEPPPTKPAEATRRDLSRHEGQTFTLELPGTNTRLEVQKNQTLTPSQPFKQVSFMMRATSQPKLEYRVQQAGRWGTWAPVLVTWSGSTLHNALVMLEQAATSFELRGTSELETAHVEFFEEVVAQPNNYRAPTIPGESTSLSPARAPSELVVSREEWGAAEPAYDYCTPNTPATAYHDPAFITIHHSGNSAESYGDPYELVRANQNYVMTQRGFCDTAYHFMVTYDGTIFQGTDETIQGEHVSYRNQNNVGIALFGNFDEETVPSAQFNAAADITAWVASNYDIPLDREHVLGHKEWGTDDKSCPGANLLPRLEELVELAGDEAPPTGPEPEEPNGTTLDGGPFNLRSGPGTDYSIAGSLESGVEVTILCTARGTSVEGEYGVTDLWDYLGDGRWISDALIYTGTSQAVAPACN